MAAWERKIAVDMQRVWSALASPRMDSILPEGARLVRADGTVLIHHPKQPSWRLSIEPQGTETRIVLAAGSSDGDTALTPAVVRDESSALAEAFFDRFVAFVIDEASEIPVPVDEFPVGTDGFPVAMGQGDPLSGGLPDWAWMPALIVVVLAIVLFTLTLT